MMQNIMYGAKSNDLQKYCAYQNCVKQIEYSRLKTSTNDTSVTKRTRFAQYVSSANRVGKCTKKLNWVPFNADLFLSGTVDYIQLPINTASYITGAPPGTTYSPSQITASNVSINKRFITFSDIIVTLPPNDNENGYVPGKYSGKLTVINIPVNLTLSGEINYNQLPIDTSLYVTGDVSGVTFSQITTSLVNTNGRIIRFSDITVTLPTGYIPGNYSGELYVNNIPVSLSLSGAINYGQLPIDISTYITGAIPGTTYSPSQIIASDVSITKRIFTFSDIIVTLPTGYIRQIYSGQLTVSNIPVNLILNGAVNYIQLPINTSAYITGAPVGTTYNPSRIFESSVGITKRTFTFSDIIVSFPAGYVQGDYSGEFAVNNIPVNLNLSGTTNYEELPIDISIYITGAPTGTIYSPSQITTSLVNTNGRIIRFSDISVTLPTGYITGNYFGEFAVNNVPVSLTLSGLINYDELPIDISTCVTGAPAGTSYNPSQIIKSNVSITKRIFTIADIAVILPTGYIQQDYSGEIIVNNVPANLSLSGAIDYDQLPIDIASYIIGAPAGTSYNPSQIVASNVSITKRVFTISDFAVTFPTGYVQGNYSGEFAVNNVPVSLTLSGLINYDELPIDISTCITGAPAGTSYNPSQIIKSNVSITKRIFTNADIAVILPTGYIQQDYSGEIIVNNVPANLSLGGSINYDELPIDISTCVTGAPAGTSYNPSQIVASNVSITKRVFTISEFAVTLPTGYVQGNYSGEFAVNNVPVNLTLSGLINYDELPIDISSCITGAPAGTTYNPSQIVASNVSITKRVFTFSDIAVTFPTGYVQGNYSGGVSVNNIPVNLTLSGTINYNQLPIDISTCVTGAPAGTSYNPSQIVASNVSITKRVFTISEFAVTLPTGYVQGNYSGEFAVNNVPVNLSLSGTINYNQLPIDISTCVTGAPAGTTYNPSQIVASNVSITKRVFTFSDFAVTLPTGYVQGNYSGGFSVNNIPVSLTLSGSINHNRLPIYISSYIIGAPAGTSYNPSQITISNAGITKRIFTFSDITVTLPTGYIQQDYSGVFTVNNIPVNLTLSGTFNRQLPINIESYITNAPDGITYSPSQITAYGAYTFNDISVNLPTGYVRGIYSGTIIFQVQLQNGNFAEPPIANDSFQYINSNNSTVPGWDFKAVLMNNSSAWAYPIPYLAGDQAVSLQQTGSIKQSSIPLKSGTYRISFSAYGRPAQAGANPINVIFGLNGMNTVASYNITPGFSWTTYTGNYTINTSGNYELGFYGTTTDSDKSTAIQDVRLTVVS